MKLHPHQEAANAALLNYFAGSTGNPLVVMPTGTGKSVSIASWIAMVCQDYPGTRVIVLTHVRELIMQDYLALMRFWPEAPAGVYSAGLNRRDANAQILFAGIQSVKDKAAELQRCDLLLIDEAHLIGRAENSAYRKFIAEIRAINAGQTKVIGWTATPYRTDSGMLHEGRDRLFTDIAFEMEMLDAIEQGFLSPVRPKDTATRLDVSAVGKRGGEYIQSQLEAAVDQDVITRAAVAEIVELGEDRGSWLCFCSGVRHAIHVRDAIRACGIDAETVAGDTPGPERQRILDGFRAGKLRAVTNANVLTVGFDAPGIDLIAMLRPTKSIGLYVQMVGRGTRLANGKEDCLILDFAGNALEHGPVDQARSRASKRKESEESGVAPSKVCPECKAIVAAATRECMCGHEFPPSTPAISSVSGTTAILSTQIKSEWVDVHGVTYRSHTKAGGIPTLEVTYKCGMVQHREWIAFEHTGYARQKACTWWNARFPGEPVPLTVEDALRVVQSGKAPTSIKVRPVGKYTEILGSQFV